MQQAPNAANRYLWFRPNSAIIWFRMAVPKRLWCTVGKTPITEPLGTTDVREARVRAWKRRAELLEEWDATPASAVKPPARDAVELAVAVGFDQMLAAMEEHRKTWPDDHAQYESRLAERELNRRRWLRRLQDGDFSKWEGHADRLIAKHGLPFDKGSEEHGAFVRALAESTIDAMGVFARRAGGEFDAKPRAPIVREVKAKSAANANPGETIADLFERWASERLAKKKKRFDTVNQDRKKIQQFAAFVGADRAVDSITAQEVFEYRETLRDLPPKWAAKKTFKGLSIREAAKRARELDLPRLAFTTINQHLSTISPLYTWLAKQPAWVGLPNPCNGLFHDDAKGNNPRPPLTTTALNKLVSSPLFTGFLADGHEHTPGDMHADDWRKWVLFATMFTGARVGEIAQLRVGDVYQERGVWLVHILEEETDSLTTKNRGGHHVPVHSRLAQLGFVDFVKRQREARGDGAPLFIGIERDSRGHFGKVARWFRDYFAAIGIKEGSDGIGPHSFRHTLSDRLRTEAELLDGQIAVILDHSIKTTTGGYGGVRQGTVKMMQEWMEAVTWEGVDFSHVASAR
jgi:integrase